MFSITRLVRADSRGTSSEGRRAISFITSQATTRQYTANKLVAMVNQEKLNQWFKF